MFTAAQKTILEGKLDKANVKSRRGPNGKNVSYLEAWHVISVANEVFGHGGWDAETVEMRREHEAVVIPPSEERPRGGVVVTYSAKVRVTVYSEDGSRKIVRERYGGHRGEGATVGDAIENCIKAAESDALKRALVSFGNCFGLALYDKEQRNVGTPERRQIGAPDDRLTAPIDEGFDQSQPERQSTSERARAASRGPAPSANGRDRTRMPF